jgi:hypothetical protein
LKAGGAAVALGGEWGGAVDVYDPSRRDEKRSISRCPRAASSTVVEIWLFCRWLRLYDMLVLRNV